MKVALCCIVKMENNYLREWVEHYKSINVDKIFMYDNNDIDGETPSEVLLDYVDSGFVEVIDVRGKTCCQNTSYLLCLNRNKKDYDWIAYFDADEFLDVKDIKNFLSNEKFKDFFSVKIPWKIFDDNDIVESKGDYSMKRFTRYKKENACKAIVNTEKVKNIFYAMSPHGILYVSSCDPNGDKCMNVDLRITDNINEKKYDVWLNHYMFKTIQEYIDNKMVRLYPDQPKDLAKTKLTIERFFRYNNVTQEKLDYLESRKINTGNLKLD